MAFRYVCDDVRHRWQHRPGSYHLAPRGMAHQPIRSEHGAILFIRGKEPSCRDTSVKETLRAILR